MDLEFVDFSPRTPTLNEIEIIFKLFSSVPVAAHKYFPIQGGEVKNVFQTCQPHSRHSGTSEEV